MKDENGVFHSNFEYKESKVISTKEKNIRQMPLYLKSIEIFKLCSTISSNSTQRKKYSNIDQEFTLHNYYSDHLISDAVHLTSNLAAAANTNIYKLRLYRSNRIKKVLSNILENCDRLEKNKYKNSGFIKALRKETKIFRKQFSDWMNTFPSR